MTVKSQEQRQAAMADVVIYTRPFCGFCARAVSLLGQKGVAFTEIEAGMDPDKRREMMALERAGKLDPLLHAA